MKKAILLFTLLFSLSAFSQIKVIKNETLTEVGKDNSVALYKKQNKYIFNYQDINSGNLNTYRSFTFLDLNKDYDHLYKLISDGLIDAPKNEVIIELPSDIIGLNFAKNYGETTVQIIHYIQKNEKTVGKTAFLTKRQIDKIFGKKVAPIEKPVRKVEKTAVAK